MKSHVRFLALGALFVAACETDSRSRSHDAASRATSAFTAIQSPDPNLEGGKIRLGHGSDGRQTIGQTFTTPAYDARFWSFAFRLSCPFLHYVTYTAKLYAWDGNHAVGEPLWTSGTEYYQYYVSGEIKVASYYPPLLLTPGATYVMFVTVIGQPGAAPSNQWCDVRYGSDYYAGGQAVTLDHTTESDWTTKNWTKLDNGDDLMFDYVFRAITTSSVTVAPSPSIFTEEVTFTGTVSADAGVMPTGAMIFLDGANEIGRAAIGPDGKATLKTRALSRATHAITAVYDGPDMSSVSPVWSHVVDKASSTNGFRSTPNPAPLVSPVRIVSNARPVLPVTAMPSGTVQFFEGTTLLGASNLNETGFAEIYVDSLPLGPHTLHTVYLGDNDFEGSTSPTFVQTITEESAAITLTATPSPSHYGDDVKLIARLVGGNPGMPTGTVTFKNETSTLGTAPIDITGFAMITTNQLPGGAIMPTVEYSGNASYAAAIATTPLTVERAITAATAGSTANPTIANEETTLLVEIASTVQGKAAIGGEVEFFDGKVSLGRAVVTAGKAQRSVMLPARSHAISAKYLGDENYAPSTAPEFTQNAKLVAPRGDAGTAVVSSGSPPTVTDAGLGEKSGATGQSGGGCRIGRPSSRFEMMSFVLVALLTLASRRRSRIVDR